MALGALVLLLTPCVSALTTPPWTYTSSLQHEFCIEVGSDSRWGFLALPDSGPPPPAGWPVYVQFVIDLFGPSFNKTATCGGGGGTHHHGKPFSAFSTPEQTLESCYPSGGGGNGKCDYDQESGALWDQRLKQYLIANGIAVLQLNPRSTDTWDNTPAWWNGTAPKGQGGRDRVWLPKFFEQMQSGAFGPLDASKLVLHGWSGGAQMVSWMIQILATSGPQLFPGVTLKGGVMLSGGSYACYNDVHSNYGPSEPVGTCQGCTEGGPSHCAGDPKCSSCSAAVQPYCQQCCPQGYTEQFYEDHPDRWIEHPPIFLGQTSSSDTHADLCACKNYHETLISNGVRSELHLVPTADEKCFCVGTPGEPTASGSPYAAKCSLPTWGKKCSTMGGENCCIAHTQGFAAMVEPAAEFVLSVTSS